MATDNKNTTPVSDNGNETTGFRLTLPTELYNQLAELTNAVDVKFVIVASIRAGLTCGIEELDQQIDDEIMRVRKAERDARKQAKVSSPKVETKEGDKPKA